MRCSLLAVFPCAILLSLQPARSATPDLTPTVDLDLQPVEVAVPPKYAGVLPEGFTVNLPPGFRARLFAAPGLEGPRMMAWSPDGVLHVANMKVDSPNQWSPAADRSSGQVVALPDRDRDGVADTLLVVADGFWWANDIDFYRGDLYVADTDRMYRLRDRDGDGFYEEKEVFVDDLPTFGPRGSNHVTKTVVFDERNERFFMNVGSPCDLCRTADPERAAILVFDADGGNRRVWARGLRNAVGLALHPLTNELWGTHNGHDRAGGELPPEWVDVIREGDFKGWPLAFAGGEWVDFGPYPDMLPITAADSALVASMRTPAALIPAHLAPMGIHFYTGGQFPDRYRDAAFVALRGGRFGSNLALVPGFKVIVVFADPDGGNARVADFLTGLGPPHVSSLVGKPVGVTSDAAGNLYVTSDHTTSMVLRIEQVPLRGTWEHNLPDTVGIGTQIDLELTVWLTRFDAGAAAPVVTADLRPLGGVEVPLAAVGDSTWHLRRHLVVAGRTGAQRVGVRFTQDTAGGLYDNVLSAFVTVLPTRDLLLFDEALAPGWSVDTQLDARLVDLAQSSAAYSGERSARFETEDSFRGWLITFSSVEPSSFDGFERLRLALRVESPALLGSPRFGLWAAGESVNLIGEGLVDLTRVGWQVVDIPAARFAGGEPFDRLQLSGNWGGELFVDDIRLVTAYEAPTAVADRPRQAPVGLALGANYPNPFNSATVVPFRIDQRGRVELAVYSLSGQRLARLVSGTLAAGSHTAVWDGRDEAGQDVASGVYLLKLTTPEGIASRKALLLR